MEVPMRAIVTAIMLVMLLAGLFLAACATPAQGSPDADATLSAGGSPTPGAADATQLLQARCTRCHSLDRVRAAHKTRAEWEETASRMRGKGAKLTDAEAQSLIEYLAAEQGR
jgi:cytochrome c5